MVAFRGRGDARWRRADTKNRQPKLPLQRIVGVGGVYLPKSFIYEVFMASSKNSKYWHERLVKWGRWKNGGRTIARTSQDAIESGVRSPMSSLLDSVANDYSQEKETDEFIRLLHNSHQSLVVAVYVDLDAARLISQCVGRNNAVKQLSNLAEIFLSKCTSTLVRLHKQRLRGEHLDPKRVRRNEKRVTVMIQSHKAAAVAVD